MPLEITCKLHPAFASLFQGLHYSLADFSAQQTSLYLDRSIASASNADRGGNA